MIVCVYKMSVFLIALCLIHKREVANNKDENLN